MGYTLWALHNTGKTTKQGFVCKGRLQIKQSHEILTLLTLVPLVIDRECPVSKSFSLETLNVLLVETLKRILYRRYP
jgi:hypothetical protein